MIKSLTWSRIAPRKVVAVLSVFLMAASVLNPLAGKALAAENPSSEGLTIETGDYGEISSIKINNDAFPTEYVMNRAVAPEQNTADHQWLGELMFTYRLDQGEWLKASTNQSGDVRQITKTDQETIVTYAGSQNEGGIRDFKVVETYTTQPDGSISWKINLENTSGKSLEIGDYGVPLPFNEQWNYGDSIYETRVVSHSFVGKNSSYITAGRPSGIGSFLLMTPDSSTGAGFEYQDRWRDEEHPGSKWAWNPSHEGKWIEGLNVFYIHSKVIESTNRGYLPSTSLVLEPGKTNEYGFKFFAVASEKEMKDRLYQEGLIDTTVVPGMIVPTDQKAKFDLRTQKTINSVEDAEGNPVPLLETKEGDHHIYELQLTKLGQNNITVNYGDGYKTVLQFYGIDPVAKALNAHSEFMVDQTQLNDPGNIRDKVFDDWMMNTKQKRNNFSGYWGWGDDWGLTHGEFLAEKNALAPVAKEITALDDYLEVAIWTNLMNGHHDDYLIHDFLMPEPNDTPTYRGYAYPHIYNTYFSMYKIAKEYPDMVAYKHDADTYLLRAYNIMKALYEGPVAYNWNTGLMGELTTPDIIQALEDEGYLTEANDIRTKMIKKYNNFKNTTYPYGSEYSYDNTGEEAVYTLAKMQSENEAERAKAMQMMSKINDKTRASRGSAPVWYYYADPVTNTGENWWNFQYTASLAGYAMDDWIRYYSGTNREEQQRLSYAAKVANISAINSGQISDDPANYGAAAWTYQAEKGNQGTNGTGGGNNVPLMNGWRGMTGESDLGLFGALKTLSADVAVDPIFGLTGYGANVTTDGSSYSIVPTDGLFMKLNLITEKLYIELHRDNYSKAEIAKDKNAIKLEMNNLTPGTAHTTQITLEGLKQGAYEIKVDGSSKGKLNAFGDKAILKVDAPAADTYTVELTETTPDDNTAPVVQAGEDQTLTLTDDLKLAGQAEDDGLPAGKLTTEWSLESGPEGAKAEFGSATSLQTTVQVNLPGEYVFKLAASDSLLSGEDTVKVTVLPEAELPEQIASYKFDETTGTTAADSSRNGKDASLKGSSSWTEGRSGNAVHLAGKDGYVKLPENVLGLTKEITISAWTKANKLSDYARLFDMGTGTDSYMFLAPKVGSNMVFSITTGGNQPGAEQSITGPALTTGEWRHIALTLSGSVGILYVDGIEVGRNSNLTLSPRDLGKTKNNFIGKSQYSDPYYEGDIDDFQIFSRALSAEEIAHMVAPPIDDIDHLETAQISTPEGTAPKLPSTVKAVLKDNSKIDVTVKWDAIDPEKYAKAGNSFTVEGIVVGSDLQATAKVEVTRREIQAYPDLVVRYNFDEGKDLTANDSSANQLHAALTGKLDWSEEGHSKGSLKFSGTSGNYLDAGNSTLLQPESLTLSYWIKRTESMNDRENVLLWFKPDNNYAGKGFFITYNGTSNIVFVDGANGFSVKESPDDFLPLNEWTHVVVTFDATTATPAIYKNGVPQAISLDGTPATITATSDIKKIGVSGYGNGAQLHADLDDFRIYSGAMSPEQVKGLYEGKDVQQVSKVEVSTRQGTLPNLPESVQVTYEDGSTGTSKVLWGNIDPAKYSKEGTFTIEGLVDGTSIKAEAVITVTKGAGNPDPGPNPNPNPKPNPNPNPTPAPDKGSQVVKAEDLNKGAGGKVTVKLEEGKKNLVLPSNAVELLNKQMLVVSNSAATLEVPASVLNVLAKLVSHPSDLVLTMESSEPSLTQGKLTSAGNAVNIKAAARNADGSMKELSAFSEPIQIHFSYQGHESDENLLGVYAWNRSTSKWDYIGAKMNKNGKQISAEVSKPGIYTVMSYHASFSDLPASHWAHDAIASLAARYIINGINDNSFAPQGLTTRAEFAAMLVRALGIPSSSNESVTFSDVKATDWFVKDVKAAMAAGLIKGVDEQSFAPNQTITREQMAVLLLRALEYKKQDGLQTPEAANSYADQEQVSSWAQKAVDSVTQLGLMKGKGHQKFDPLAAATRAETAKVMNELLLKLDMN